MELDQLREEERIRDQNKQRLNEQVEELTRRLQQAQQESLNNQNAADLLNRWAEEGLLDQDDDTGEVRMKPQPGVHE